MHDLVVPLQFSGERLHRDQRSAEEVGAFAIAAPVIGRGFAEGLIQNAALGIDSEESPHIRTGAILPRVAFPGVGAGLSGTGHGVKLPDEFAGVDVPRARVARSAQAWALL